jgi:hypothetical protein
MNYALEFARVLIWPVTTVVLVLLFREVICGLVARLSQASLPGGVTLDFQKELAEAKSLSREVAEEKQKKQPAAAEMPPIIPVTEVNEKMLSLGLRPSPSGLELAYYQDLAERDPAIALAGLRIELEIMGQNLARGFSVEIPERASIAVLYRTLADRGAITSRQFELVQSILRLCNAAIHGAQVTRQDAARVIETAAVLRDQYLNWLSWGFKDQTGNVNL